MKLPGLFGLGWAVVGAVLLLATFAFAYFVFTGYRNASPSSDLATSMGTLLYAAIQALFLGIMGWVGSIAMLRGLDFVKVDRGVGVVTFRVDKGVGILTSPEPEEEKKVT
jgi:hypothetical protein